MDIYREHITTGDVALKEFFGKPKALQRYAFVNHNTPVSSYVDIVVTDDYAVLESGRIMPVRGLNSVFPCRVVDYKWTYSAKKKRCPSIGFMQKSTVKYIFEKCTRKYCFVRHIPAQVLSGSIVRDILYGKITNPRDAIRQYGKSLGIKNLSRHVFTVADKLGISPVVLASVINLEHLQSCHKGFIHRLESDFSFRRTFCDTVQQAYALEKKIDIRWSVRRINKIHTDWTRQLMKLQMDNKAVEPIWEQDICEQFASNGMELLNTEHRVFEEGCIMNHCCYTNYWSRIRRKGYLAIHIDLSNGPATAGLCWDGSKFRYEQAFHKSNGSLSSGEEAEMNARLSKVSDTLDLMASSMVVDQLVKTEQQEYVFDIPW